MTEIIDLQTEVAEIALNDMPIEQQVLVWRRRALTAERYNSFEEAGKRAYFEGTPREENPYKHAGSQWLIGWNAAKNEDAASD
jgi:ribosome modulation factor